MASGKVLLSSMIGLISNRKAFINYGQCICYYGKLRQFNFRVFDSHSIEGQEQTHP